MVVNCWYGEFLVRCYSPHLCSSDPWRLGAKTAKAQGLNKVEVSEFHEIDAIIEIDESDAIEESDEIDEFVEIIEVHVMDSMRSMRPLSH